jgi:hypothetical protein
METVNAHESRVIVAARVEFDADGNQHLRMRTLLAWTNAIFIRLGENWHLRA